MEYFYLYIFILLCFIVAVSYYTTYMSSKHMLRESFNSNKSFVLLGDSILKNAYVSDGKSVENLPVERTNGLSVLKN